ncbi:MAG: hypothetical protein RJA22_2858 [Verrucomicrobiota bacterium]
MIQLIFKGALRQRVLVLMAGLALIVGGAWSALRLPIDAVPDITNVQVQINTTVPALSPEEIERQISFPIETEMAGLPALEEVRSLSKFGLSQITLVFAEGTDIYRARQLISERLQGVQAELPPGAQPRLGPISTGLGEVFFYAVDYRADATNKPATRREQLLELRALQDWVIKPAFRGVAGVADIETVGGYERQIVVTPDPRRLAAAGLTFEDLAAAIRGNVENTGGGLLNKGGEQVTVRTVTRVQSLEDIAGLPIKFTAGRQPLLVRDVAEVGVGSAFRTGAGTANGREALVAYVLMMTGENSRLVARRAHEKLAELQDRLPPGIELKELYNRSELVDRTIATVRNNLLEGALLVIAILFALLGNWRAALIVTATIPLSLLFTFVGMVHLGISGNLMSLGAIDFGLVVDGAVVIAENAVRLVGLRQRELGRPLAFAERLRVVLASCRQVGGPMVFGVTIITIVYVPLLALGGTSGKMFRPMAATVMLALLGSLLLALTLIPVLCAWFLSRGVAEEENAVMRGLRRAYHPLLLWGLHRRAALVALVLASLAGSGLLFRQLGQDFVPQLDEGSLVVQIVGPTSASLEDSIAAQERAEQVLLGFPEIASVFSRIGTPEIGTDPMGANLSDTFIQFTPRERWRQVDGRPISRDALVEDLTRALEARVPGRLYLFTQPIEMRFNEMLEGARSDIAVKIYGEEFSELQRIAREVRPLLEAVPGTAELELDSDNLGTAPVLEILPDREAMRRLNVDAAGLNETVGAALGGRTVGTFLEGNRRSDIVVRLAEPDRARLEDLPQLPVPTRDGALLPLSRVARVAIREQVNMIEREGGRRRAGIDINLRNRDLQGWVNEARAKVRAVNLPPGYEIEFGGQFQQLLEARQRLLLIAPLALVLIFLLTIAALGRVRQAALVLLCVPLAMTGGIAALALRGLPFSITAAVGFIALSGIAVLNGLILLTFINQLRQEGLPLRQAVIEGALTRLRPKLMTALVASVGFIPMALATGPGAEVQRPLATVVIGGILSSTFLTLVLLPTLYDWIETRRSPSPTPAPPP